jgi:cytochrome c oxidase subunit II
VSIHSPPAGWFKAPTGAERMWVGLALTWCLVMFVMMPYWHFRGKQNSTGESYAVKPADFMERVERFSRTNHVGEYQGIPIVEPAPGGDAYLLAKMWSWTPILRLREGQTYRLHISSADLQHGFSLQPMNMNFHVLPGYDHVLTIVPNRRGEYSIVCNEFCGIGHHQMTGRIIVE